MKLIGRRAKCLACSYIADITRFEKHVVYDMGETKLEETTEPGLW